MVFTYLGNTTNKTLGAGDAGEARRGQEGARVHAAAAGGGRHPRPAVERHAEADLPRGQAARISQVMELPESKNNIYRVSHHLC